VPYHFIGHKCQNESCGSYNTNVLSTEGMPLFSATGELLSSPAGDVSGDDAAAAAATTAEATTGDRQQLPVDQVLHMLAENGMEFFSDEEDDDEDDDGEDEDEDGVDEDDLIEAEEEEDHNDDDSSSRDGGDGGDLTSAPRCEQQ
jgi:hypothetical protein